MTADIKPPPLISVNDALNGIYIDFEGPRNDPPALLGLIIDGCLERVVLDRGLQLAAEYSGVRLSDLDKEYQRILDLALAENRKIIAFSHTERTIFKRFSNLSERLSDFESVYLDMLPISRQWTDHFYPDQSDLSHSLKDLSTFIGFPYPPNIGNQVASKRIRDVKDMLASRDSYHELTGTAKGNWTNLLKYNRFDCENLYLLTRRIASNYAYKD